MKTLAVSGWNAGFQKVAFTNLLKSDFGYSLFDAKAATDSVLDNHRLALDVAEADLSRIFQRLVELGAMVSIEESRSGKKELPSHLEFSNP